MLTMFALGYGSEGCFFGLADLIASRILYPSLGGLVGEDVDIVVVVDEKDIFNSF